MQLLAATNLWEGVSVVEDLMCFSPMLALICTMLAVVITPIIAGRQPKVLAGVAILGTVVSLAFAWRVAGMVGDSGVSGLSPIERSGMLIADNLSIWFQFLVLFFVLCITALWWVGSADTERDAPEFFILLLGSALGMMLMVSTSNLLMMVIAIETASLPSYAMVGFDKRNRRSAEASLKYMIFGAISAALMFYGVSLLYGTVGSLSFGNVAQFTVDSLLDKHVSLALIAGLVCMLAGISFKISAVPFHFWCPDAFEGARIEVTTWLSVVSKAAALMLLMRLVLSLCAASGGTGFLQVLSPVAWTLGIVAAITCTVGNFAAFMQTSVKRMLAYSSIAHAGYMLMATTVFLYPFEEGAGIGVSALLLYVVVYLFMNLGAFGVVAMVYWQTGRDDFDAFAGLMRKSPWLAVPMVICLVSLVGLPPFAGFIAKWWLLVALGELDSVYPNSSLGGLGWFLVTVAVINTLISLYYYMRVVKVMALEDDDGPSYSSNAAGLAIVNGCAVILIVLLVLASPLKSMADRYAKNLFIPVAVTDDTAARVALDDSSIVEGTELP